MTPDATRLRALTRGEVSLAQWHHFWRHGFMVLAVGWMLLSVFALHWLITLTGAPDWAAWAGAFFYEGSVAGIATTATTVRRTDGKPVRSPWLVLVFFMLIAQVCNVFHALVSVSARADEIPPWMPAWVAYALASVLAALFPLGGTLLVAMSGFLRMHGADASWVDEDARTVAQPARTRAPRKPRVRTDHEGTRAPGKAADVPHGDDERAPGVWTPTLTDEQLTLPEIERARILWAQASERGVKLTAGQIKTTAAIGVSESQIRRWVGRFSEAPQDTLTDEATAVEADLVTLMAGEGGQQERAGAAA